MEDELKVLGGLFKRPVKKWAVVKELRGYYSLESDSMDTFLLANERVEELNRDGDYGTFQSPAVQYHLVHEDDLHLYTSNLENTRVPKESE